MCAFKFIKTGAASAQLAQKAAAEAEAYRMTQGKMYRFWLKQGDEARITFVDGNLDEQGFLCPARFYEHNLILDGQWGNLYVCPARTDPANKDVCPICESGDRAYLVALFTIIDHRIVQSKDKTKTYKDTKRLFAAKPQTFEILNKIAIKRGGLAGATFDVSRVGDKAASVGSMFDFVEKKDVKELQKLYTIEKINPTTNQKTKVTNFTPADYEAEIVYRTGAELVALGLGKPVVGGPLDASGKATDYTDQL